MRENKSVPVLLSAPLIGGKRTDAHFLYRMVFNIGHVSSGLPLVQGGPTQCDIRIAPGLF